MVLQADPSLPPLLCSSTIDPAISSWLCENSYWPIVHTIYPMILYSYLYDVKTTVMLFYVWESIEAVFEVFARTIVLDVGTESLGDSLLSDVAMGLSGIFIYWLASLYGNNEYRKCPPLFSGFEVLWLKYVFQFIVLALPTGFLQSFHTYFAGGLISITYIIMMVYVPVMYGVFMYWNRNDPLWYRDNDKSSKRLVRFNYKRTGIGEVSYEGFNLLFCFAILLYFCLYIYRWASVFIMAVVYNTMIIVCLAISLALRSPV